MVSIQLSKLYGFKDTQKFWKKSIESTKEFIQATNDWFYSACLNIKTKS